MYDRVGLTVFLNLLLAAVELMETISSFKIFLNQAVHTSLEVSLV